MNVFEAIRQSSRRPAFNLRNLKTVWDWNEACSRPRPREQGWAEL